MKNVIRLIRVVFIVENKVRQLLGIVAKWYYHWLGGIRSLEKHPGFENSFWLQVSQNLFLGLNMIHNVFSADLRCHFQPDNLAVFNFSLNDCFTRSMQFKGAIPVPGSGRVKVDLIRLGFGLQEHML